MDIVTLRRVFAWCLVVNIAILVVWFVITLAAHDQIRDMQMRWFGISANGFEMLNLGGLALYKMQIWFFNIAPYLALHIIGRKRSAD